MTGWGVTPNAVRGLLRLVEEVLLHPLKTPQNALNPLWGKFERGKVPFSIEEEMSRFARYDQHDVTPSRLCEGTPTLIEEV